MKDEAKARAAFNKARAEQEKIVQAQPDYGPPLCVLGLIDAALGRKEAALEEGRRAIELLPAEKDFIDGNHMIQYFAIIAAWAGEKDLALQQLESEPALQSITALTTANSSCCPSGIRSAAIRASKKSSPRSDQRKRSPCRNRIHLHHKLRRNHPMKNPLPFCLLSILARHAIRNIFAMGFRKKSSPASRKSLT